MTENRGDPCLAPEGAIYVCGACGKTSPHKYGGHPETMRGWDVSCAMNSTLCVIDSIKRGDDGRATEAVELETWKQQQGEDETRKVATL